MPSSLLQVVINLFQTCYNKLGTSRLVTTCAFLRVYQAISNKQYTMCKTETGPLIGEGGGG